MQLINNLAGLIVGRIDLWQQHARIALLNFVTDKQTARRAGTGPFVRELRALRVQASQEVAPAAGDELRAAAESLIADAQRSAGAEIAGEDLLYLMDAVELGIESTLSSLRDALRIDEQTVLATLRQHLLRNAYSASPGLPVVDYRQRARNGARWSSLTYADATVRKFLVDTHAHAVMVALRASGRDTARVFCEGSWVTFSIAGATPGLPTLEQVEHLIHPNLQKMVEPA